MSDIVQNKVWNKLLKEVQLLMLSEPLMAPFLEKSILKHASFQSSLGQILLQQLVLTDLSEQAANKIICEPLYLDHRISQCAAADLVASYERDAACDTYLSALLYFKGFQALQLYRIANWYWCEARYQVAYYLQSQMSQVFDVDIHPGASIGEGIMLDHATGLVVSETASVGNNVSILHSVTLSGNGCTLDQRYPIINDGVLISAGAKVIGNVVVKEGSKIGAGSLVIDSVPAHATVVGVPARVVGRPSEGMPALNMNQNLDC
ncbi:MAG TPA: serine O-acetyltransferase [Porticoccaceae bacterium]|jgi:serine O-acetyltransferase|nr:serine O-acetyltransferase [Porticoccaceae bacterium]